MTASSVKPNDAFWTPSSRGRTSPGSEVGPPGTIHPVPSTEPANGSSVTKEADDSPISPRPSPADTTTCERSGPTGTKDSAKSSSCGSTRSPKIVGPLPVSCARSRSGWLRREGAAFGGPYLLTLERSIEL
jgi:hypothetical protein